MIKVFQKIFFVFDDLYLKYEFIDLFNKEYIVNSLSANIFFLINFLKIYFFFKKFTARKIL